MWLWIVTALALLAIWIGPMVLPGQFVPTWVAPRAQVWASVACASPVVLVTLVILTRRALAWFRDRRRKRQLTETHSAQPAASLDATKRERLRSRVQAGRTILTRNGGLFGKWSRLNGHPWVLMLGDPASGKTAALQCSGLHFPVADPEFPPGNSHGPTQQLRWWFSNDGVLLEAPGCYAADPEDRQEWREMLGLLGRGRKLAVDVLVVCVSSEDLGRRSAAELKSLAGRLRHCIDDVIEQGGAIPAIHVLVTKADLVPGFDAFFANLAEEAREQPLGFSFESPREQGVAGEVDKHFDTLVEQLEHRAVRGLGKTTHQHATSTLQFPSEFAQLREPLHRFCDALFQHNAYGDNPRLRGVCFSSALREGAPLDSVLAHDASSLGLGLPRSPAAAASEGSFFLKDWLARHVLQDSGLGRPSTAARTRGIRRGRLAAAAAAAFSIVLLGPAIVSYRHHRALVSQLGESVESTQSRVPETSAELRLQLRALFDLRAKLDQLDHGLDWGMRPPVDLARQAQRSYGEAIARLVIDPTLPTLRHDLLDVQREVNPFETARQRLKLYLGLHRPEQLSQAKEGQSQRHAFVTDRLVQRWRSTPVGALADDRDDKAIREHLDRWLDLIEAGGLEPLREDRRRVQQARQRLAELWAAEATLYRQLLGVVEASTRLPDIDREALLRATSPIRSDNPSARRGAGDPTRVPGLYTRVGFTQVFKNLERWEEGLTKDAWVIADNEKEFKGKVGKRAIDYRQRYTDDYIEAWRLFLTGLRVTPPKTLEASRAQLNALFPRPFQTLLEAVQEHTQIPDPALLAEASPRLLPRMPLRTDTPAASPAYAGQIRRRFRALVDFLGDPAPKDPKLSALFAYQDVLQDLVGSFNDYDASGKGATDRLVEAFNQARSATSNLLVSLEGPNERLLTRLLLDPLARGQVFVTRRQSEGIGELWIQEVHSQWSGHFDDYPFDPTRKSHVSLGDIQQFFEPKNGVLWQFIRDYLTGTYLDAQGQVLRNNSARRLSPAFVANCLGVARRISNELFPDKPWPYSEYLVTLAGRSQSLAEAPIHLSVGQEQDQAPLSGTGVPITWPSEAARTANPLTTAFPQSDPKDGWATLSVGKDGATSDTSEEITREGEFGLFELLGAAEHVGNYEYRWKTASIPGGWVLLRVEPTNRKQGRQGVSERLFRDFRLPKSIFQ